MRALLLVAVAACTPEIVSGAYLCGPDQACPQGQACNGDDNTCVVASEAMPFACDPATLHEPDDTPAQGFQVPTLACVSAQVTIMGCLAAGDGQNWLKLAAPANCASVAVRATVAFPVAFEPIALDLRDLGTGTDLGADMPCASTSVVSGDATRCLSQTLTDGGSYGLAVMPAGGGDCGGACNYNRYSLTIQLVTP